MVKRYEKVTFRCGVAAGVWKLFLQFVIIIITIITFIVIIFIIAIIITIITWWPDPQAVCCQSSGPETPQQPT